MNCKECGDPIEDVENAAWGGGTPKREGTQQLVKDGEAEADELFEFDDGPYCSLGCVIE